MRLVAGFFAIVLLASLIVPPAEACEKSCRVGVCHAIANAYIPECNKFWDKFLNNCLDNWDRGIEVSSEVRSEANDRITTVVAKLQKELNNRFYPIIYDSVFKQEPKFMGDCGHPRLVIQPKVMPWPRDSCENQAYICGNPPAVCHFLNKIIKPRVFENIGTEFEKRAAAYPERLQAAIGDACKAESLIYTETTLITTKARENLIALVRGAIRDFPLMFCYGDTCDKYDENLRLEILKWP